MKEIHLWGVKQNNLKNIEVRIPLGQMTVVCGPSGSGKSSLAFETLFAEGQRRFIESMSNYARQFLNKAPKPDIEGITNIPPAISIEQKNTIKSSRSTVGTTTEVIDYLRLLFEKIGVAYCPDHALPLKRVPVTEAVEKVQTIYDGQRIYLLTKIDKDVRVAQGKKLLSMLIQDGYLRIYVPTEGPTAKRKKTKVKASPAPATDGTTLESMGQLIELDDPRSIKKGLPASTFYLVIDRLLVSPADRDRLADSMTQAYEASIKYNTGLPGRQATVLSTEGRRLQLSEEASCPVCAYVAPTLSSRVFSFNSPIGACPTCKGFGNILGLDEAKVIPNPELSLSDGALHPFTMPSASYERKKLIEYCKKKKISLSTPWKDLSADVRKKLWEGDQGFFGVLGLFEYLEQIKYKMHVRVFISRYRRPFVCKDCGGSRLRREVAHVFIGGESIQSLSAKTIEDLRSFFDTFTPTSHQLEVAGEILKQIRARLDFLSRVGVNYLCLDRETRTLSGGEYQRLILANQLGMGLSQSLYVLDEPTVGLHPRDNDRLISILNDLRNLGNTLVVVEHDHDVIKSAENVIEMGPGSGSLGGEVVYSGPTNEFHRSSKSVTAPYLKGPDLQGDHVKPRPVDLDNYRFKISVLGARGNNLRGIDVTFPLHRLVAVTGVSGSGKSTLVSHTLYPALARALGIEFLPTQEHRAIEGVENVKNVIMIDQSAIGKSARSSPITYMKAFDAIRSLMAAVPEAKFRGYTPGTFSLNVDGGRCPSCKGTGFEEIDMMFMDDVVIPCDVCDGKKYRSEILEIEYKGRNIHQILAMTVAEAMGFFVAHPNIRKPLAVLKEVGLEYLTLGQPASSLSGGESQRLKIAKELAQVSQKSTLYILDEPTTGLHFREIDLLMSVLHRLIDAGGSVIVVEHNLDVIRKADYVIDMGPDAGKKGGQVVAFGTPEKIMKSKKSLTGNYLRRYLERT